MICATAPYLMAMTRRLRRARNFREEPANIYPIAIVTAYLSTRLAPGSAECGSVRGPQRSEALGRRDHRIDEYVVFMELRVDNVV